LRFSRPVVAVVYAKCSFCQIVAQEVVALSFQEEGSKMAPLDDTTPANRFDSFHVFRTSYKKIGAHEIEVGILVPKDVKPGKYPVMVKFHGGGLVRSIPILWVNMSPAVNNKE
jgi:acetyl esterase/lipase